MEMGTQCVNNSPVIWPLHNVLTHTHTQTKSNQVEMESASANGNHAGATTFDFLACVETFILPKACQRVQDARHIGNNAANNTVNVSVSPNSTGQLSSPMPSAATSASWLDSLDLKMSPRQRLEHTCVQVCLADHMQTMYRDPDDDLQVCLSMRTPGLPAGIKLPSKLLQERILEGQIRIVALCRLCYSSHNSTVEIGSGPSLEYLRARNDLASSYAQAGLWSQAKEIVDESHAALLRMCELPSLREAYVAATKRARMTATIVLATFRLLRSHAAVNCGQITMDFTRELIAEVGKLPLTTAPANQTLGDIATSENNGHNYLNDVTRLISAIHDFIAHYAQTRNGHSPSWGNTIDYLRHDCIAMKELFAVVEDGMLPQYRASLLLTFQQCDRLHKRIAHSVQLSQLFHHMHNTSRAIAGCSDVLMKYLTQQVKTEVSLQIDADAQCVVDVSVTKANASKLFNYHNTNNTNNVSTVVYELPITYEEVLSFIIKEQDVDAVQMEMSHLLTLRGIVQIFSGHITDSEVTIREALRYLEQQGLEMEAVACELYNTIAQLMIVKFRQAESKKKAQIKRAATEWLLTEQGRKEMREQMKIIRAHYMNKNMIVISAAESELKARNYLIKNKMKEIQKFSVYDENGDLSPPIKMVDAAYRYVVRSYDILESVYGQSAHPSVATACLAVASVLNMAEKHADAREWLARALRSMEKLNPVPIRSVAYAQIQLSKVLQAGQFVDEAITVLSRAVMFFSTTATDRLKYLYSSANTDAVAGAAAVSPFVYRGKPYPAGQQPYEDVEQALTLGNQMIAMQVERGNAWPAAEQSEVLAELAELAYGWDSPEAGDMHKQAGERYLAIKDLGKATSHYRRSLETLECIYDKVDPRCLEVSKIIAKIQEDRAVEFNNELGGNPNPESSPTNHSTNTGGTKRGKKNTGNKKNAGASSFTDRLRAAWGVQTTDLIRTTMDLDEDHPNSNSRNAITNNAGAAGPSGPDGDVLVGFAPENQLIAKYHTDIGLVGLQEPLEVFDKGNSSGGSDNQGKRSLSRQQPRQQLISGHNNHSENSKVASALASGTFRLDNDDTDNDLDLF
jgi:tetratricopeptide (TPR) repeat protein